MKTLIIESKNAVWNSSVTKEGLSDFSVRIPNGFFGADRSKKYLMTMKAFALDVTNLPSIIFEIHVAFNSSPDYMCSTQTGGPTYVIGYAEAINALSGTELQSITCKTIGSFSRVITPPSSDVINVKYIRHDSTTYTSTSNYILKNPTVNSDINHSTIVLEFVPYNEEGDETA